MIVEELVLLRRPLRRAGMRGKIFLNGKGRDSVDLPLAHEAHRLVAQLISMVDRGHPRLGGVQSARLTFTVHRDACLQARSLGDGLRELRLRVLENAVKLAALKEVAAGFVNLDEIRPLLDLLANDSH